MKITSINERYSKEGEIAIHTEPSLNAAIFAKLLTAWRASPIIHSNPIKVEAGLLIIRISVVTPEIATTIQQLLIDAEQAVKSDEIKAQEKVDREKAEHRQKLEAAAKVFGVPIN